MVRGWAEGIVSVKLDVVGGVGRRWVVGGVYMSMMVSTVLPSEPDGAGK